MNVLILTGKFGLGHCKAAAAVKEQLEGDERVNNIEIVDIMEYLTPHMSQSIYKGFAKLVSGRADLYNVICKTTGKYTAAPFKKMFTRNMHKLLTLHNADIVVSTLPMCSQYIGAYKEHSGDKIPLITYITDISSNSEWIANSTDLYVVATEEVKNGLIEKGINPDKIRVGGIPVRAAFLKSQEHGRIEEKMSTKNSEVLIMGGGLGLIPNAEELLAALDNEQSLDTTIITGTNEKLYNSLSKKYKNINVVGYTERVDEYMKKADVLVTKPGGITMFEAINSGTPIFAIKPFLEQEVNNAAFIESHKIGEIQWNDKENTLDKLKNLLASKERLSVMAMNMWKLRRQQDHSPVLNNVSLEAVAC
ncbi:MAG TPA: glycosyltransferase [Anaerovoracaceae bacterium]|nr:glycosyltransferase [Anaerovoracaceae bacterium]